jgi:hypothetical protein
LILSAFFLSLLAWLIGHKDKEFITIIFFVLLIEFPILGLILANKYLKKEAKKVLIVIDQDKMITTKYDDQNNITSESTQMTQNLKLIKETSQTFEIDTKTQVIITILFKDLFESREDVDLFKKLVTTK